MCHNCNILLNKELALQWEAAKQAQLAAQSMPNGLDKTPRSQKMRGLKALMGYYLTPKLYALLQEIPESDDDLAYGYPMFARPCPVRPRHGFVESRVVKDVVELRQVLKETFKADPEGELMLMEPIDADWNAVWTPAVLTFGPGHDGATAGKGAVAIPLAGVMPEKFEFSNILGKAGFEPGDYPYVEIVHRKGDQQHQSLFTQVRAGVKIESTNPDFIPEALVVKRVVKADAGQIDLLEWEKIVQEMEPGDVVWHPTGSLTDHISVHARAKGVPILKTREPIVGEKLKPIPVEPLDPHALLRGAVAADEWQLSLEDSRAATNLILVALHNAAAMRGEHARWLGAATVLMIKLGMIACRGEARHHGGRGGIERATSWKPLWKKSLRQHRAGMPRIVNLFRYGNWPSSGYGGIKWAQCAVSLAPLLNALQVLAKEPTIERANELLAALNVAVNQAHNGGWWLNKFTESNAPDVIQKCELTYVLKIAEPVMQIDRVYQEIDKAEVSRKVEMWGNWAPVRTCPPKITQIEATIVPYSGGLNLSLSTKLTKKHKKEIIVPFDQIQEQLAERLGNMVLISEDGGLSVEARMPGQKSITVWKEPRLEPQKVGNGD
jgi:hypothetical protein